MSKLPEKIHSKIYDRMMTPLDEEALELAGWSKEEVDKTEQLRKNKETHRPIPAKKK